MVKFRCTFTTEAKTGMDILEKMAKNGWDDIREIVGILIDNYIIENVTIDGIGYDYVLLIETPINTCQSGYTVYGINLNSITNEEKKLLEYWEKQCTLYEIQQYYENDNIEYVDDAFIDTTTGEVFSF